MQLTAKAVQQRLQSLGSPEAAALAAKYFKTGPGEYGEGDIFWGIRMPVSRKVAQEFRELPETEVLALLSSTMHEERLVALLMLVERASQGNPSTKKQVFDLYLQNTDYVNNWDLVDTSAPKIVGGYLVDKSRKPLHRLATSTSLWERRIAIIATQYFIQQNDFADTLKVAEMLLNDQQDLIHKATGWMLREVGKRDRTVLEQFLQVHFRTMPRTMLRYAIERFPEARRQMYLHS